MKIRLALPAGLLAMAAAPAWAHAILMESTPALNGQAAPGAQNATLRFNSLIDVKRSRVLLTAPDSQVTKLALTGGGRGDTIHASTSLVPGHYVLRWQVLAIDGHITRGEVPFDVAPASARIVQGH